MRHQDEMERFKDLIHTIYNKTYGTGSLSPLVSSFVAAGKSTFPAVFEDVTSSFSTTVLFEKAFLIKFWRAAASKECGELMEMTPDG